MISVTSDVNKNWQTGMVCWKSDTFGFIYLGYMYTLVIKLINSVSDILSTVVE